MGSVSIEIANSRPRTCRDKPSLFQ